MDTRAPRIPRFFSPALPPQQRGPGACPVPDLAYNTAAGRASFPSNQRRAAMRLSTGRQQQRDQDADDRDHHQQLDKCRTQRRLAWSVGHGLHLAGLARLQFFLPQRQTTAVTSISSPSISTIFTATVVSSTGAGNSYRPFTKSAFRSDTSASATFRTAAFRFVGVVALAAFFFAHGSGSGSGGPGTSGSRAPTKGRPKNNLGTVPIFPQGKWDCPLPKPGP